MKSTLPASGKTVLGRLVARTLDFAEGEGLDRRMLVIGAGLEGVDLTRPNVRVPFSVQTALWSVIRTQTTDRAFGIKLGASLRARELGLLGYAMYFSSTLRGALRRLVRYNNLFNEAVRFRFERPGAHHIITVDCPFGLGSNLQYSVDTRMAGLLSVAGEITGVDLVPVSIAFAYDRPPSAFAHSQFFRCPLSFGARITKLSLRKQDLELPVPRGDEQVAGYLSEHAETVLRSLTGGGTAADGVRSAIWTTLCEGRPSLHATAAALRVSARTLQRQLADEGTSFSAELEQVRSQMSIAALRDPSASIDDVAFLLGYAEPSSFYRSFRRWTGQTPHEFRRSATSRPSGLASRGREVASPIG